MEDIEYIKYKNKLFGIVLRKRLKTKSTIFFSPTRASLQVGIVKHKKGYREIPHAHKEVKKTIFKVEQFLLVKSGRAGIDFFRRGNKKVRSVILNKGDGILIIDGAHALNTFSSFEALTVKQGPFLGDRFDKVGI